MYMFVTKIDFGGGRVWVLFFVFLLTFHPLGLSLAPLPTRSLLFLTFFE